MDHRGLAYYAGLLSAASLHGAAHQRPMVFQVEHSPAPLGGHLNYLLERAGAAAAPLAEHVAARASHLRRWRLLQNEAVEPDL